MSDRRRRYLLLVGVSLVLVALDQITKMFVVHTMRLHESISIIEGFFNLTYIRNPGAAFGIFATTIAPFDLSFSLGRRYLPWVYSEQFFTVCILMTYGGS